MKHLPYYFLSVAALRDQGLKDWKTRNYYTFVADEENQTCVKLAFQVEDLTADPA